MDKFKTRAEYQDWINSQDWYQTIDLKDKLKTPGKVRTNERDYLINRIDFTNKTVIDVGCNSGQYALVAKKRGAQSVVGIDFDPKRIEQAKILAINESLDINFHVNNIYDISGLGKFDIVICVAVLTEVHQFLRAVEALKSVMKSYAFIELNLAKPMVYISRTRSWMQGNSKLPRTKSLFEARMTKRGELVLDPTLEVFKALLGPHFKTRYLGRGVRYDMVEIIKTNNK